MHTNKANIKPTGSEIAAWICVGLLLLLLLKLHLLPALLAGLLVYELVHVLAPQLRFTSLTGHRARVAAVAALATLTVISIGLLIWGVLVLLHREAGNIPELSGKIAEILSTYSAALPLWLSSYLPSNAEALKTDLLRWINSHTKELQLAGKEAVVMAAHIIVGMVLGMMVSLKEVASDHLYKPLARALIERAELFGNAFRAVVFAQLRIAVLNTVFTAIYLAIILPLLGIDLPLVKTMIAITFVAGLIPVIGNVISNTIIVIVSMSHAPAVAAASLVFLLVIHKLEYFLNARIIGGKVHAAAWELLVAMLFMEAAFGIEGLIAAPIYYAYIKSELVKRGLV